MKQEIEKKLRFGAIADDYTGGSDLAGMLSGQGVSTVQVLGVQPDRFVANLRERYHAVVISLKSRSIPATEARRLSLRALQQLRSMSAQQIQFKYCSTFDSTPEGNIGPVIEELMEAMGLDFTVAVPALPVNQRLQFMGYLFVDGRLLSESHMRYHPATPMTDANLLRHLQAQMTKKVGLISYFEVRDGAEQIHETITRLRNQKVAVALADVLCESDLQRIAEAVIDFPLITGSSGLAMKLPSLWAQRGWLASEREGFAKPPSNSRAVLVVSGSCSERTLQQLRLLQESGCPSVRLDVLRLLSANREVELESYSSYLQRLLRGSGQALLYSSASIEEREEVLRAAGETGVAPDQVRLAVEISTGEIVRRLIERTGVSNLIVAGGETSGAVMEAIRIRAIEVGEAIDPGVPICRAIDRPITFAFKSGNFGSPDFFIKAIRYFKGE